MNSQFFIVLVSNEPEIIARVELCSVNRRIWHLAPQGIIYIVLYATRSCVSCNWLWQIALLWHTKICRMTIWRKVPQMWCGCLGLSRSTLRITRNRSVPIWKYELKWKPRFPGHIDLLVSFNPVSWHKHILKISENIYIATSCE